jgi:hypothetical protein
LGVQTSLEKSVNSPKFYLDFIFMNINLVGFCCMSKCGVSIKEPIDLV